MSVSRLKKVPKIRVSRCVLKGFDILLPVHIVKYHITPYKQRSNVSTGKTALPSLFQCVQREFPISCLDTKTGEVYKGKRVKSLFRIKRFKPGHITLIIATVTRIQIDVSTDSLQTHKEV